jgi:hypothetical protein
VFDNREKKKKKFVLERAISSREKMSRNHRLVADAVLTAGDQAAAQHCAAAATPLHRPAGPSPHRRNEFTLSLGGSSHGTHTLVSSLVLLNKKPRGGRGKKAGKKVGENAGTKAGNTAGEKAGKKAGKKAAEKGVAVEASDGSQRAAISVVARGTAHRGERRAGNKGPEKPAPRKAPALPPSSQNSVKQAARRAPVKQDKGKGPKKPQAPPTAFSAVVEPCSGPEQVLDESRGGQAVRPHDAAPDVGVFVQQAQALVNPDGHFGWTLRNKAAGGDIGDACALIGSLDATGLAALLGPGIARIKDDVGRACCELYFLRAIREVHSAATGFRGKRAVKGTGPKFMVDQGLALCHRRIVELRRGPASAHLAGLMLSFSFEHSHFVAEQLRYGGISHYSPEYRNGWRKAADAITLGSDWARSAWSEGDFDRQFPNCSTSFALRTFVCRDHAKELLDPSELPRNVVDFREALLDCGFRTHLAPGAVDKLAHVIARDYLLARSLANTRGGFELLEHVIGQLTRTAQRSTGLQSLKARLLGLRVRWVRSPVADPDGPIGDVRKLVRDDLPRLVDELGGASACDTDIADVRRLESEAHSLFNCIAAVAGKRELFSVPPHDAIKGRSVSRDAVTFYDHTTRHGFLRGGAKIRSQNVVGKRAPVAGQQVIACGTARAKTWIVLLN